MSASAHSRNLIFCADGTWASPQSRDRGVYAPSNVVKIVKTLRHGAIAAHDPFNSAAARGDKPGVAEQLVFYDQGVGTGDLIDRLVGGATGAGLEQNVCDGYHFLVSTYQPGDRIFLLGFSRGAYTVRRLAGFLCRFGLLRRADFSDQAALDAAIQALYQRFLALADGDPSPPDPATENRLAVAIEALGVWDTVGALGLPEHPLLNLLLGWNGRRKQQFIDKNLSPKVHHAYHALALDEPRAAFAPALWEDDERTKSGTLQQVWFAGAHSNIGGSYQECGLADIALLWMINRLRQHRVAFREDYVARYVQPDPWGEVRNPREGWLKKLLYRTTLRRVPGPGTYLHASVGDRGIPTTLYRYQVTPGDHPFYRLEHGLYTNAPTDAAPATSTLNEFTEPPPPALAKEAV